MEYRKLQAPTLKDLFIQEIESKILSGELEIGEQLLTERELAEVMGINRNIVHSGIAALVAKGFLEIQPRVGTFVADYNQKGSVDILVSMMNYNKGMLRRPEVRSSIELKILFDTFAIRQMTSNITKENKDKLQGYLFALEKTSKITEAAEIAYEFFRYMSILSGNTILPLIYNAFRTSNRNLFERHIRLYGIKLTLDFMTELFNLITNEKTDEAVSYLTTYYERSIKGDLEIYNE
jgi:GntR family transcriptional regulator, transcriptional repressor for pyruvate dehydrogenase complex